jgi:hypothetical protein
MHNRWFISGNIFTRAPLHPMRRNSPLRYRVEFKNIGFASTLRQIILSLYVDGDMRLDLNISPFHINEYHIKCKEIFEEKSVQSLHASDLTRLSISSYKSDFFSKLISLFDYFNKKYKRMEFTEELIAEFRQITLLLPIMGTAEWGVHKHILSEDNIVKTHINPGRKNTRQLNQLIQKNFSLKKFREALVSGESPNQIEEEASSLQTTVSYRLLRDMHTIRSESVGVSLVDLYISLQLLYFYGANIFDRNNGGKIYQSDFELAYISNNKIVLDFMMKIFSTLEKPVKKVKGKLTISSISYHCEGNQIAETKFHFSNNLMVSSKYIHSSQLTVEEKNECFLLFKKFFKDPNNNNDNVVAVFNDVFSPAEDRFIELDYIHVASNGAIAAMPRLCGINLREAYQSKILPDHIVVHGVYTFLEPELRHGNLSGLLAFSLHHVFKLLYPHYKIVPIYNTSSYAAYTMVNVAKSILHCPKYQSPLIKLIVNEFIAKTYANDATILHEEMTWGVREKFPLTSNLTESKRESSFLEDCYKEFIAKDHYPFVAWHVSKESLEEQNEIAKGLGLDFLSFAHQQAKTLKKLIQKVLKKPSLVTIAHHSSSRLFQDETKLFWKEEKMQDNIRARL